jgi:putative phage-type endonuclease
VTDQGTDAWKLERCGKIGASSIGDLMAKTKSGPSASRTNLIARLVCERLTGAPQETYTSPAMAWGTEHEADARRAYEDRTGAFVEQTGWVPHPEIDGSGCSPDGLVGDDGLLELKCPATATHIETLLTCDVDRKYILQMQWQMATCGRQWCDFGSFDPRMPENLRLFVTRVKRDDALIAEITSEVRKALDEVATKVQQLSNIKEAA